MLYNVPLYALQFISPFTSGLSVGQTLVIAVSFPSIRYVLTQSLNFPRAFVVVGYKVKDVTDVHGAAEPIDFHEPDWHGGQCQSGLWLGGNKVNYSACKWYEATSAHFIGGRSGGSIYYKPIQCPAGYVMTGTRMYGIGDGVDEEHVDAYCCPFG
uniref:Shufflon protein D n=1 Tax=Escherichia coli TaxID=562 RepID=A0A172DTM5_ECOLX|nr:Shufflon protein D [Escherichia coli]